MKINLRTPKGTVDFHPADSKLVNEIIDKCKKVFEIHGGRSLDTPTFELLEIMKNKSEEESLIFELNDQGGDICGLRFDLTVPLARYLAQNKVSTLRRYQIGKVFRRDQPAITKGRYREFYQCDFDICGNYLPLLPDAESVKIASEILESFQIGDFVIKINHRKLISAMCMFCLEDLNADMRKLEMKPETAASENQKKSDKSKDKNDSFSPICSAIDKLEKIGLEKVKEEIIKKGWSVEQTEKMAKLLQVKTVEEIEQTILFESKCEKTRNIAKEAISDLKQLFDYLELFDVKKNSIKFDISLARGLNYYTGIIFEAVYNDYKDIGSVCGGGRYDQLVGQFCKKEVPAIGFSIGILRIFSILSRNKAQRNCFTRFLIVPRDKKLMSAAIKMANKMWKCEIATEINLKKRSDTSDMKKYCNKEKIPYLILIGDEISENMVVLTDIATNEENMCTIDEVIEKFGGDHSEN